MTVRVLQSFPRPRKTTNPYIHMLDAALTAIDGVEHERFSWRTALTGRYDVIHFHWPEALIEGRTAPRRFVKRLRFQLLLVRLRLHRTTIARTIHNLELPSGISGWDRRMLTAVRRRAGVNIALNGETPAATHGTTVVIPHGHYVEWFRDYPRAESVPDRVAFVGLVRRYKGLEALIAAFTEAHTTRSTLTLSIGGQPSSPELRAEVESIASAGSGITADLRYLSEEEYVLAVTASTVVALPYTHMHNSGSVLAALSLGRPVLVPDNEVNRALSDEVGPGWIHTFNGALAAEDIVSAVDAAEYAEPHDVPDLSRRGWDATGAAHRDAYLAAARKRSES